MQTMIFKKYCGSASAFTVVASVLCSSIAHAKPPAAPAPAAASAPAAQSATTPPAPAAADPAPDSAKSASEQCSAAYERTQTEKLAGHYVAASAAALECSQLQCNSAIVQECVRFYGALEAETPTLVFSARKAEGGVLVDVRVEMDGKLAAMQITGRPISVDPGPHEFVFVHPKRGRLQLSETARVGDKARVIEATFVDPLAKTAAGASTEKAGGVPVMSYVLAGVGVVGLGAFTYFRLTGTSDYNKKNDECSPGCSPEDIDPIRRKFTLSYVSLGVGAAALAGAAALYFLVPGSNGSTSVQASATPRGDGAMAGLKTTF